MGLLDFLRSPEEKHKTLLRKSANWPMAEVEIIAGYPEDESDIDGPDEDFGEAIADLSYHLVVNGEYYSGSYERKFAKPSLARAWAEPLHGGKLPVRYNPDNPEEHVLVLDGE